MLDLTKYKTGISLVSGLAIRGLRTVVASVAFYRKNFALHCFPFSHKHPFLFGAQR